MPERILGASAQKSPIARPPLSVTASQHNVPLEGINMDTTRTLARSSLALAVSGLALPAMAQIDEIVDTARKTEESLQSTPVAVTAFSEVLLAQAQVTEVPDRHGTGPSRTPMSGGTA